MQKARMGGRRSLRCRRRLRPGRGDSRAISPPARQIQRRYWDRRGGASDGRI